MNRATPPAIAILRWRPPLATQIIGLIIVSLMAAITVHAIVALMIPPPPPEVYRISEVATALRNPDRDLTARNGRQIRAEAVAASTPANPNEDRPVRLEHWLAHELATQFAVPDESVHVLLPSNTSVLGRRYFRAMRSQMPALPGAPPPETLAQGPASLPGLPEALDRSHSLHAAIGADDHVRLHGDPFIIAPFVAEVRTAGGNWVSVNVHETGPFADWRQRVLLGFGLSVLILCPIAYLFGKGLAAPIAGFAQAAERLGRDPGAPPLVLKGPAEIAAATLAFNQMQERIRRYVQDRTALVGAVAHDLRTPLTRLRFRIEQAPPPLRGKLAADIDEMEAMIAATLAFVRDASQPAVRRRVELGALVREVVEQMAEVGDAVTMVPGPDSRIEIDADPLGLRRVVANLIVNAVKFGTQARVRVRLDPARTHCLIEVDDNGPGLPEDALDRMFEPFARIETSRNRDTGGAGLGLAVVRSVARAHGGDAELANRPEGGLRASVILPLAVTSARLTGT